jgi:hypothetical protein
MYGNKTCYLSRSLVKTKKGLGMDTTDAASFLSHAEEPSIPDDTNAQHGTAQYCTLQSFIFLKTRSRI